MLFNFFLVLINILILIFGYIIIKQKLDNRYINAKVIEDIKHQLDSIMKNINAETEKNITLIEEGKKSLNDNLEQIRANLVHLEHKSAVLNDLIKKSTDTYTLLRKENTIFTNTNPQTNTYSITKRQPKVTTTEDDEKATKKKIESAISNMNLNQKVLYLQELEWTDKQIKDFLNISSGELELAIEMANSNPR